MTNATHDPALRSWVESANSPNIDFPIQNLPLGVFRRRAAAATPAIGVAIGDQIFDLRRVRDIGLLRDLPPPVSDAAAAQTMNPLMALGGGNMSLLRRLVSSMLAAGRRPEPDVLVAMNQVEMLLPATIGDYTDFYASIFHATRVGRLFRPDNPLLPNYKHVPIAYHGRSSSIVLSGTSVKRPSGQTKSAGSPPTFQPSARVDYEMEVGLFIAEGNPLGAPLTLDAAEHQIFGLCLVNDWSARDIQAWESQPLGPFLSKNFATTISPWVVTREALEPFRCPAFQRSPEDPKPLPYVSSSTNDVSGGFDITVEVFLQTTEMRRRGVEPAKVSRGSLRDMYWTLGQMVAHHSSNGCNLRPGDLMASGTISGAEPGSEGCLLEMTQGGEKPLELPSGEKRTFLADGDQVIMRAFCERPGCTRIGFGECTGIITERKGP